jgi:hypothetical protein
MAETERVFLHGVLEHSAYVSMATEGMFARSAEQPITCEQAEIWDFKDCRAALYVSL